MRSEFEPGINHKNDDMNYGQTDEDTPLEGTGS